MPKQIARSAPMTEKIVVRGTTKDKENLVSKAKSRGMDVACYLRQLLIADGAINADGS